MKCVSFFERFRTVTDLACKLADAPLHLACGSVCHGAAGCDDVAADDGVAGVGEPGRELRVGGEQKQSGARHVETPDRDKRSRLGAEHIEDRLSSFGIFLRRYHSPRLVERDRSPGAIRRGQASDFYARRLGDDQGRRISDNLVGDADAPVSNQLLCLASRSEAEFRQGAIESDSRHLLNSVA